MWNFKGTLWNSTQKSYPHIKRCAFYSQVKIEVLLDLRAHKPFWNAPRPPRYLKDRSKFVLYKGRSSCSKFAQGGLNKKRIYHEVWQNTHLIAIHPNVLLVPACYLFGSTYVAGHDLVFSQCFWLFLMECHLRNWLVQVSEVYCYVLYDDLYSEHWKIQYEISTISNTFSAKLWPLGHTFTFNDLNMDFLL